MPTSLVTDPEEIERLQNEAAIRGLLYYVLAPFLTALVVVVLLSFGLRNQKITPFHLLIMGAILSLVLPQQAIIVVFGLLTAFVAPGTGIFGLLFLEDSPYAAPYSIVSGVFGHSIGLIAEAYFLWFITSFLIRKAKSLIHRM